MFSGDPWHLIMVTTLQVSHPGHLYLVLVVLASHNWSSQDCNIWWQPNTTTKQIDLSSRELHWNASTSHIQANIVLVLVTRGKCEKQLALEPGPGPSRAANGESEWDLSHLRCQNIHQSESGISHGSGVNWDKAGANESRGVNIERSTEHWHWACWLQ